VQGPCHGHGKCAGAGHVLGIQPRLRELVGQPEQNDRVADAHRHHGVTDADRQHSDANADDLVADSHADHADADSHADHADADADADVYHRQRDRYRDAHVMTMPTVGPAKASAIGPDRPCDLSWSRPVGAENGSVALSVVAGCADVSRSVMTDVTELASIVFSGLSALVIDDVEDAGEVICVRARTRDVAVACPGCGALPG
jgi:hypothetical protein